MSGALEASERLKTAALATYPALQDIAKAASKAVAELRAANDVVLVMAAADKVSLAIAELGEAAERLHKDADAALVVAMDGTGCTSLHSEHHTLSLRQNPASVEITDERAVPAEYMTTPEPRADKRKIAQLLKNGSAPVNWATLRPGTMGLSRRAS